MKNYKYILYLLLSLLVMTSCGNDDDGSSPTSGTRRTIMVYFNAENNLYAAAAADLLEMVDGSKYLASDCNLLVYFDFIDEKNNPNIPTIYSLKNGNVVKVKEYSSQDSSNPDVMLQVFRDMMSISPANEYATVFWGHGDGPIIANSSNGLDVSFEENEPDSYGADYNSNNLNDWSKETLIDIPVLASVMKKLPKQKFIFFDACCMQSIEVAYELRKCADYIIGATCETPSFGAPYETTTKYLGYADAEAASKAIVNDYQSNNNTWEYWRTNYKINNVCMSVIKTADIENLMTATKEALKTISYSQALEVATTFPKDEYDATSCIYYFKTGSSRYGRPILYDMNDVMLHNLSETEYSKWRTAFDKVVIHHPNTGDIRDTGYCDWYGGDLQSDMIITTQNFRSFYLSDKTFGGVSMFFPLKKYAQYNHSNMNTRMYDYEWCREVGWKDLGW
ncbi:MAG: hypothetical protein J6P01_05805 [Prevotella sp.]|nr:hypothetical protein [Prevotella sp.]